jgi:DNA-nicking Smr family endonuclease
MMKGKDERRGGKAGVRRAGELSAEETALWRFVTKDVRPTRGKARIGHVEAGDVEVARSHAEKAGDKRRGESHSSRASVSTESSAKGDRVTAAAIPKPRPAQNAVPVGIERRKSRRIARGAEEIEARLDLHGMTQGEAHRALTHFVHRCQAQGLKTVLIITGKGGAGGGQPSGSEPRGRGVLRQNVPRWLNEPSLARHVIGYSAASVRHGGDGALYVRLRRRR